MSGSPPKNGSGGNTSNSQSTQQRPSGQTPGGSASQQQQQRLLHMQMQQQQMKLLHQQPLKPSTSRGGVPNNPLAPAPASLGRPSLTSSSSTASLSRGSSKVKGAPKPTAIARGLSGTLPLPTTLNRASTSMGSLPHNPSSEEMTRQLLGKCDWKDKTIWVARQLLGGNATNGFLKATASVQRIKRQRARQTAQSKQKAAAKDSEGGSSAKDKDKEKEKDKDSSSKEKEAASKDKDSKESKDAKESKEAPASGATTSGKKRDAPDQESEEILKKEVMNPRTAKKLRAELQAGLNWCVFLQNSIRNILFEMSPDIAKHTPLPLIQGGEIPTLKALLEAKEQEANPTQPAPSAVPSQPTAAGTAKASAPLAKATPDTSPSSAASAPPKQQQRRGSDKAAGSTNKGAAGAASSAASQASPGGESGSTLRKSRKKKLPPCTEPVVELSEVDIAGKRYSKKEHFFRIFECTRFRNLKVGDFVAARVSSRDLWILARVQKEYPGFTIPPAEFLKLSEARRDAQFKDKVAIKDVEDKEGGVTMVPRNLVLPLPRTFSEAADWAHRSMKKSRVYAMYPNTTSLYSATVVDNTTYCRGDDDILVVEFDGDEAESGVLPKYHIPARFVTLIPREFPAAQTSNNNKKRKSATAASINLPSAAVDLASPASVKSVKSEASLGLDDGMGGMVKNMGIDDLVTTDSLEDFGFDFSEDL